MSDTKLKISCRINEVPSLGGMLISSLSQTQNQAAIVAVYPEYNSGFITQANTDLVFIEALINPKQLTGEMKVITKRLYTNLFVTLRDRLTILEGYLKRANGLTMVVKDFGISAVRTKIERGDVEGAHGAFNTVIQNISVVANMTAITAKGYTPLQHNANITLRDALKNDNIAQNNKMNDRNNLVTANYIKLNEFWDKIVGIADAGKRVMKTVAPNKVNDFTMNVLKKRVRQERNNTKITGVIKGGGQLLKGASVAMKPLDGGRTRKTKSKANGVYEIISMEPGDYLLTITSSGFEVYIEELTIQTGIALNKDFALI